MRIFIPFCISHTDICDKGQALSDGPYTWLGFYHQTEGMDRQVVVYQELC